MTEPLARRNHPRPVPYDAFAAAAFERFVTANPQVVVTESTGPRAGRPTVKRVPYSETPNGRPLVTTHLKPWQQVELGQLTGSALKFAEAAQVAGHEVAAKRAGGAVCVGVRSPSMRMYWVDGLAKGGVVAGPTGWQAVNVTVAGYVLTMPLHEAQVIYEAEAAARADARAAKKAAGS